ncbi:hypothetical protein HNR26_000254 [Rhizobium rosettiformans]|uniref:Uncharacterized protein n=2 Tax=Rhizobium rosettiformans TaxID=1368430 RepID=A0A7W8HLC7_9HYPH|nr:hypothetical protein [Rhizobium rosettiformans]MBB5274216.1 hypothetical protein [Rhizobium rosettiformans]
MMDKPSKETNLSEATTSSPVKRPARKPAHVGKPRPKSDDVVRLEHERHKHLMDLLAK